LIAASVSPIRHTKFLDFPSGKMVHGPGSEAKHEAQKEDSSG
jgi:hypothetical protein